MAKKKNPLLTSPPGTSRFAHIDTPDEFKGKTNYKVDLVVDPKDPEVKKYVDKLEKTLDEKFEETQTALAEEKSAKKRKKAKSLARRDVFGYEENEDGEETGNIFFRYKLPYQVKSRKTGRVIKFRPRIFNGAGEYVENPPPIWSGSELKVSGEVRPYYMEDNNEVGLSLRLNALQVISLVTPGGSTNAEDYGFEAEEDGDDFGSVKKSDEDDDTDEYADTEADEGEDEDDDEDF